MQITTEIKLKDSVIKMIRVNQRLKNRLQLDLDISHTTLYRYLDLNSVQLTRRSSLKIISEELGIGIDELLTE